MMLQNFRVDVEHDFLGYVGNVVARTLQFTEHACQVQTRQGALGMLHDVVGQQMGGMGIDFIQHLEARLASSNMSSI